MVLLLPVGTPKAFIPIRFAAEPIVEKIDKGAVPPRQMARLWIDRIGVQHWQGKIRHDMDQPAFINFLPSDERWQHNKPKTCNRGFTKIITIVSVYLSGQIDARISAAE